MTTFYRSRTNRRIGGVCGGISDYFGIDSLLIRIVAIVLIFSWGCGLLLYMMLWLLAPLAPPSPRD